MLGMAQDYLYNEFAQFNEMAEEAIQAIHSEATRIQKITEPFLDLANLEKENVLEINEVDLVSTCESILKQLKHKK